MKQKSATSAEVWEMLKQFSIDMQQLREAQLETNRQFKETDRQFKETDRQFKETDKKFRELDIFLEKVGRRIDEQGTQIGGVHKSFGNFTEDLLFNSLQLQLQLQFDIEFFDTNVSRSIKGADFEADALAFSNGNSNQLFVIEVKTRFNKTLIKQLTKKLEEVNRFCPEHQSKKKYGVIAVPHLKPGQLQEILKAGYYPATLRGDMLVIEYPQGFKPRVYQ
ncbi:MAG: hypothetical protein HW421_59 [Ignavibacteria bacterium]|nr:hypothetical protein [Ignavibacteria bacterium]